MGSLEGKVAVVTGGTSNIGLGIARRFAREGARVLVVGRDPGRLAQAVEQIGPNASSTSADVANEEQVRGVFEPLERVDLLVTCAGSAVFGPIDKLPPQAWVDLFAARFFGQIYACHYAVPKMPEGSSIILCSGIAAKSGIPNYAGGAALCGAVNSMAKALALELAPRGIRVNAISPGLIVPPEGRPGQPRTAEHSGLIQGFIDERIPMRRPGRPDDMADAALFLATCDYATGIALDVDGGWTAV